MSEHKNYRNILIGILCILLFALVFYFWFASEYKKSPSVTYTEKIDETGKAKNSKGNGKDYTPRAFSGNAEIPSYLMEGAEGIKSEDEIANRIFTTDFDYKVGSETGVMVALSPENFIYQKTLKLASGEHDYKVTFKGVTVWGKLIREPFKCDNCHQKLPMHIADASKWGKCNTCHNLGLKVHVHAVKKARISSDNCYNTAHRIIKPVNLGDIINNNCSGCHSTQPDRPKKGRTCGNCHKSGWDPHLVVKLNA